jgi:sigma-B regulation protein RsbU (phosphoserine phosphatase)
VRAVVSDDADDELSRALGLVPKGFRYGWLVTHPVSRWEDAQPGTCLLLFFSALASDLKRLEGTYSGLLGQVLVTMVPAVMSVFIVLYLGCLAIGVFIAGAISGGIGRLYQATLEFSRGNMDHRIRYRSRDQLGELARSMNDMAGNIQRLLRESAERERLAQEFFLAQEVQRKLLPAPLPPFRGAEVAGSLRPMSEVGGDTYDWRTISERELLVMVADVSGHGLRPGLLAAMAKASLSAKLSHTHEHPEIMQALHELTLGALDRRLFMTLCLATFDLAGGRLQISSAGHPPCLRYREGAVTEILEESFPLGVRQARTFVPRDLDLRPGDVYLFISDGLVEGRDRKGAVWGYDRLAASLLEHAPKPTADIVASIQADHDRFCGDTSQGDDITLVVVAYRPGPETAG